MCVCKRECDCVCVCFAVDQTLEAFPEYFLHLHKLGLTPDTGHGNDLQSNSMKTSNFGGSTVQDKCICNLRSKAQEGQSNVAADNAFLTANKNIMWGAICIWT